MVASRVVYHPTFDGRGFTDQNTVNRALLTKPDKINPILTHIMGKEEDKFPLTFLTEGQKGGVKPIELNDIQYEWDVFEKLRRSDAVVSSGYIAGDKPGINGTPFYVVFKSNWLKNQHLVTSRNGVKARIQSRPEPVGSGHFKYKFVLLDPSPTAYCPLTELQAGVLWGMEGGAPVSESLSFGNESNVVTPGRVKNQISILRKSYHLAGNISNKVVECQFNVNGKFTSMWIDFERWQHMLNWKQDQEEHLWTSRYNRRADGSIVLKDDDTGLPIPIGAGVVDQIPHEDTFGFLTAKKLKTTVGDVFYGLPKSIKMHVVLYTGEGGMEDFDNALKDDVRNSGFTLMDMNKFVSGSGWDLTLGGYFKTYQHVNGHVIVVKQLSILDHGAEAEVAPKHPISGKPITSHNMYFVDQTTYDGIRNVRMVTQKGRGMITGVLKGMAPTPLDFSGNNNMNIATEQDKSSIHFLAAKGININNNKHCFKLFCDLTQ